MWAVLAVSVLINTVLGALLPSIQLCFLILHIVGVLAMIIPLASLGPHGNARELFTTFYNEGGWPSNGLSFLVGIQGVASAILGKSMLVLSRTESLLTEFDSVKALTA